MVKRGRPAPEDRRESLLSPELWRSLSSSSSSLSFLGDGGGLRSSAAKFFSDGSGEAV